MKKTVMIKLEDLQRLSLELNLDNYVYNIIPRDDGEYVEYDDLEAYPEVKQNQTYEDWLEETIICIKADYTSMSSITKALKQQANFIWKKLCDKDDRIVELERGHAEISKGYPDIIQDLVSTGDGLIAENEFLNKRIVELETKLANATRLLLQMKGETDE